MSRRQAGSGTVMNGRIGTEKLRRWRAAVRRGGICFALLLLAFPAAPGAESADQGADEYRLKAQFLYNFITFTEWPAAAFPDPAGPLVVGILGEDPFRELIDNAMRGKAINGRPIQVRRIAAGQDGRGCQVLFISASEKRQIGKILEGLRGASTLTVADTEGFPRHGGIVNFFIEEKRLKFEVNVRAAGRAQLRLSSRMLQSAKISNY